MPLLAHRRPSRIHLLRYAMRLWAPVDQQSLGWAIALRHGHKEVVPEVDVHERKARTQSVEERTPPGHSRGSRWIDTPKK